MKVCMLQCGQTGCMWVLGVGLDENLALCHLRITSCSHYLTSEFFSGTQHRPHVMICESFGCMGPTRCVMRVWTLQGGQDGPVRVLGAIFHKNLTLSPIFPSSARAYEPSTLRCKNIEKIEVKIGPKETQDWVPGAKWGRVNHPRHVPQSSYEPATGVTKICWDLAIFTASRPPLRG